MSKRKLKLWELNRLSEAEFKAQKKFPIRVVLDDIRSLNNIGSFFRTADAFNVEHLHLCGITACPPHKDIQKTALGATESITWSYHDNCVELVQTLQAEGYFVAAVEQAATTVFLQHIHEQAWEKIALVFGNEVDGVQQEVIDAADCVLEIPQFGTKHSLNVSVCAGVVLWEVAQAFISSETSQ